MRKTVGEDRVRLPADEDEPHRVPGSGRPAFMAALAENQLLVAITLFALLIVGVTVTLATHSWWAVVAACVVHAVGTVLVINLTLLGGVARDAAGTDELCALERTSAAATVARSSPAAAAAACAMLSSDVPGAGVAPLPS